MLVLVHVMCVCVAWYMAYIYLCACSMYMCSMCDVCCIWYANMCMYICDAWVLRVGLSRLLQAS